MVSLDLPQRNPKAFELAITIGRKSFAFTCKRSLVRVQVRPPKKSLS
jgi:hypothetical protein